MRGVGRGRCGQTAWGGAGHQEREQPHGSWEETFQAEELPVQRP